MRMSVLTILFLFPVFLWARPATRGEVRAFCETIADGIERSNGGYSLNMRRCLNGYITASPADDGTVLEGVVLVAQRLSDMPDEQPWGCSMKYIGRAHADNVLSNSVDCTH